MLSQATGDHSGDFMAEPTSAARGEAVPRGEGRRSGSAKGVCMTPGSSPALTYPARGTLASEGHGHVVKVGTSAVESGGQAF